MYPFYILVLFPMLLRAAPIKGKGLNERNQFALKIFFVLLFALLALRHISVGIDLVNYKHIFLSTSSLSWNAALHTDIESGYSILNRAIAVFTTDFQWFLAIIAAMTMIPIGYTYIKESKDATLTIVLFISLSTFVMLFSGLRQSLAISLGIVAYWFTKKHKLILFILIVMIAIFVHTSAFMLVFMYPVYHAKISRKSLMVIIPALFFIMLFNQKIFGLLAMLLERYTKYEANIKSTGAYTMLILFMIFAVYSFVIPDESKLDADTKGMRNFLLLSVAIQVFAPLHSLAMRMNYYYIIFIPLLMPKLISCCERRWNRLAVASRYVMVLFFALYFFTTSNSGKGHLNVFPFHFFWENV